MGTGPNSALQLELCKIPTLFINVRIASSSSSMGMKSEITSSPTIQIMPGWPNQPKFTNSPKSELTRQASTASASYEVRHPSQTGSRSPHWTGPSPHSSHLLG